VLATDRECATRSLFSNALIPCSASSKIPARSSASKTFAAFRGFFTFRLLACAQRSTIRLQSAPAAVTDVWHARQMPVVRSPVPIIAFNYQASVSLHAPTISTDFPAGPRFGKAYAFSNPRNTLCPGGSGGVRMAVPVRRGFCQHGALGVPGIWRPSGLPVSHSEEPVEVSSIADRRGHHGEVTTVIFLIAFGSTEFTLLEQNATSCA
jgi:hypothetical protein